MLGGIPRHVLIAMLALLFITLWLRGFEPASTVGVVLGFGLWFGLRLLWARNRRHVKSTTPVP